MSKTETKPDYRIFKTLDLARLRAKRLTERTWKKHVVLCIRQGAYLVAHEEFNPIKLGFGYPTFR